MIATINGKLHRKTPESVIIVTGGLGYEVFISLNTFYRLPDPGDELSLITHTHVREDCLQLFGFIDENEKQLFHLLLGVAKIGPKLALNILSGITPVEFRDAVLQGNQFRISQIPRVGKKTAERIIVELKDKIKDFAIPAAETATVDGKTRKETEDALEALMVLGYSRKEAEAALGKVMAASKVPLVIEELIRESLTIMTQR